MRFNFEGRSSYPSACFCESTLNARVAFSGVFLRIVAGYGVWQKVVKCSKIRKVWKLKEILLTSQL